MSIRRACTRTRDAFSQKPNQLDTYLERVDAYETRLRVPLLPFPQYEYEHLWNKTYPNDILKYITSLNKRQHENRCSICDFLAWAGKKPALLAQRKGARQRGRGLIGTVIRLGPWRCGAGPRPDW
jgi:hypothetical protein